MFRSYITIALRNLTRNKISSFINIFGLATGLATCLLIMLYIFDERSYDKHQQYGDRSFRIASINNQGETWAAACAPLAFGVKNELPEVEQATRLMTFPDISKMLLKYQDGAEKKQFFETNGYYVDSTFFQIFTYDFTYGNPLTALNDPNSLVISQDIAQKFFGPANPIGKTIAINTPFGEFNYTVKAVFNNHTYKSHIPANYFLSMRNNDMYNWVRQQTSWLGNNVFFTYVKLKQGTDARQFEKKLQSLFEQKAGTEMKAAGFSLTLLIQPVKDIYLHSSFGNEIAANGNITYLYILASIAAFILIIACVNFMNLSTARSEKRAKEVGIKKVVGASRNALIRQFLGESFLMCIFSLLLALGLVKVLLPYFNDLTQKHMQLDSNPTLLLSIAGLTAITGLIAGAYPAFYLSAFKPASILKGKIRSNLSGATIRKGLVVFQFTVSICLIIAAIIIGQQLEYFRNRQMGFSKSQKLILPMGQGYLNDEKSYTTMRNELLKYPEIRSVAGGNTYPGIANLNDVLAFGEGRSNKDLVDINLATVGEGYVETLGFQLLNGRAFSSNIAADSASIILNETAVKQLGYTAANAVGRSIHYDIHDHHTDLRIVGVLKDFNFESLHKAIHPFGLTTSTFGNKYSYIIAATTTNNYTALLRKVRQSWTKLFPAVPFEYSFLDEDFQRNYEKEQLTSGIVAYFTIIAILIACLGLFGLMSFASEQRSKEIGIRKVLGASIGDVTALLSKDFLRLVLLSVVIASPLSWFLMDKWLQNFAYRTPISWSTFLISGGAAVLIAMATVSYQAIKTALTNPVDSLKAE